MWKCPNCETINESEKCFICGTPKWAAAKPKPKREEDNSLPLPPPPKKPEDHHATSYSGSGTGAIIRNMIFAIAAIALVVFIVSRCS